MVSRLPPSPTLHHIRCFTAKWSARVAGRFDSRLLQFKFRCFLPSVRALSGHQVWRSFLLLRTILFKLTREVTCACILKPPVKEVAILADVKLHSDVWTTERAEFYHHMIFKYLSLKNMHFFSIFSTSLCSVENGDLYSDYGLTMYMQKLKRT